MKKENQTMAESKAKTTKKALVSKQASPKVTKEVAVEALKESKVAAPKVASTVKKNALSAPVYSLAGQASGSLDLPTEVFGGKINTQLLSQAIRIYQNNQTAHFSHTKTRAEVRGSTKKLGSQKGGGRARHGNIRAPIFVGGGIALGPKSRKVELELPKKMKRQALISALSQKATSGEVLAIDGVEKATGKTKQMIQFIKTLGKANVLFITDTKVDGIHRAVRNIDKASITTADQLNAFEVIKHSTVVLTDKASAALAARVKRETK
jgi:large subunit ribosomal protein L4